MTDTLGRQSTGTVGEPPHQMTYRFQTSQNRIVGDCQCGRWSTSCRLGMGLGVLVDDHQLHARRAR
jgi:hypothetical protein